MSENYKLTIMKELSIEEKAKRYESALERCRKLYNEAKANEYTSDIEDYEAIFPELAESEDEKIRKWLICTLKSLNNSPVQIDGAYEMMLPAIAWLEKQVPVDEDEIVKGIRRGVAISLMNHIDANSKGMCLSNMECEDIENAIVNEDWDKVYGYMKKKLEKQGEKSQGKSALEAIKEEKVDNANKVEPKDYSSIDPHFGKPADKVEPKFHEGDIIKPKDGGHEPWQIMQVDISDKKYRFKDGYVIHFSQEDDYELVEQKNTWTKEDNEMLDSIIEEVRYMGDFPDYPTKEEVELYDECLVKVDWLKSLKERYTWKPSDEQIKALTHLFDGHLVGAKLIPKDYDNLRLLLEQLKKLREE